MRLVSEIYKALLQLNNKKSANVKLSQTERIFSKVEYKNQIACI